MHDIIVVGGGPAGLTAAVYGLRAGKSVLVIEKAGFGGQIAFSPKVENIPGTVTISGVKKTESGFVVDTEEGSSFEGKTVILANGVKHRMLGLPGEEELIGKGISFCAVCDGAFYTGQETAMIGGGNSALQEALLLSEVCTKVTVVQNLPTFTGEQKLADALMAKDNVKVLFNTVVSEYVTENGELTGLKLHNDATGDDSEIRVDGAFLAVGLQPQNEAFVHLVDLNQYGYYDVNEFCATKTPGVYVAGDCRSKFIRQVTTAASDGAVAALAACRYVDEQGN